MNIHEQLISDSKTILDVGGWFKPDPRATHVVDLLPWETRCCQLNLSPLRNERFSKKTWFQADFSSKDFRLPFGDKFFDLVICGQTVEDLPDPTGLLDEMQRVGKAGVVECPSRWSEQTVGVRDRENCQAGHPHHCWIVDQEDEDLVLYCKQDSRLDHADTLVPLDCFESSNLPRITNYSWENRFDFRAVRGEQCFRKARKTVADLNVSRGARTKDSLLRFARRVRSRVKGRGKEDFSSWREIVEQSRPYSSIELPRLQS